MAYNLRTRRVAYDNISTTDHSGGGGTGVAGKERTILGNAGSTEVFAGGSRIILTDGATSPPASSTEPTTNFARNRIITEGSSGVTSLDPREYPINQN